MKPAKHTSRLWEGGVSVEPEDPLYARAVGRLKRGKLIKRTLSSKRELHICRLDMCHPEREADMIIQGHVDGPPLTNNVFLCDGGIVHVCTERSCDYYASSPTHTCHITGLNAGVDVGCYDKNDSRTWYSKPRDMMTGVSKTGAVYVQEDRITIDRRKLLTQSGSMVDVLIKERKRAIKRRVSPAEVVVVVSKRSKRVTTYNRASSGEVVRKRAQHMVELLLHSNCRGILNKKAYTRYQKEAKDARDTYLKTCKERGQWGFVTDVYRVVANKLSQPLPLVIFNYNEAVLSYYVDVICQVWGIIVKYYVHPKLKQFDDDGEEIVPKIDVDSVCIGVLYNMRYGYQYGETWLLPRDEFLFCHLPLINDLAEFQGISKPKYTKGTAILTDTYENAVSTNVPLSEISITEEGLKESVLVENGVQVDAAPWILRCKRRSKGT
jgi:hypothetical protein